MSQEVEFKLFLKLHRQQLSAKERARTRNIRGPRTTFPVAIEETYAKQISTIQEQVVEFVQTRIKTIVPKLVLRNDGIRKDDVLDEEYARIQQELEQKLVAIYGASILANKEIASILASVAEKTKSFRESQFSRQILAITGIPFKPMSPNWRNIKAAWELTNYTLIKNLSQEYIQKINTVVLTGIQAGWTSNEIAEEITKLGDKIKGYRAKLIARDQMGKLNNKITKDLHLNLGIDTYLWITARDERVRGNPKGKYPKAIPSHWEIDGAVCKWSDPSVYTKDAGKTWNKRTATMPMVEPGLEIACRCTAHPVLSSLLFSVDADIRQQGV